jgi:hypothetical protein
MEKASSSALVFFIAFSLVNANCGTDRMVHSDNFKPKFVRTEDPDIDLSIPSVISEPQNDYQSIRMHFEFVSSEFSSAEMERQFKNETIPRVKNYF